MRTLLALKIVINFGGSEKICNFAKLKYGFGFSGSEKERHTRRTDTSELKLRARTNPPGACTETNPPDLGA